MHGGSAPQVKAAAAERIAAMVDPALTELQRIMTSGESDQVRLAAVKDVLDRAGYKPKDRLDVTSADQPIAPVVAITNVLPRFDPEAN